MYETKAEKVSPTMPKQDDNLDKKTQNTTPLSQNATQVKNNMPRANKPVLLYLL